MLKRWDDPHVRKKVNAWIFFLAFPLFVISLFPPWYLLTLFSTVALAMSAMGWDSAKSEIEGTHR